MISIIKKLVFKYMPAETRFYSIVYRIYRIFFDRMYRFNQYWDGILFVLLKKTFVIQLPDGCNTSYKRYIANYFPRPVDYHEMRKVIPLLKDKPLISILVPVYNTPPAIMKTMIESVQRQLYDNWELCLVDDCSTKEDTLLALREYMHTDRRINILFKKKNEHICMTTQAALDMAKGSFIALLDHDDYLTPDALYQNVLLINKHPKADMIYSDEAIADTNDTILKIMFKPDWSPETFFSTMYTCHFTVLRKSIVKKAGGFRPGYDGSQDYDITLRVTELTDRIYHIPRILYYWRFHSDSVTMNAGDKLYAFEAGKKALNDALKRRKEPGYVDHDSAYFGKYQINYNFTSMPSVEIMIHSNGDGAALTRCLSSLSETDYQDVSISVVSTVSINADLLRDSMINGERYPEIRTIVDSPECINNAVRRSKAEYIFFIDSSVYPEREKPQWLKRLVEQAKRKGIGAVTPMLLLPHYRVYTAGMALDPTSIFFRKYGDGTVDPRYDLLTHDHLVITHNIGAVPPECFLTSRKIFLASGGFDPAFCSRTIRALDLSANYLDRGMRNLCVPFVRLFIDDIKNENRDSQTFYDDGVIIRKKWNSYISHDPYYNTSISAMKKYQQD